MASLVSNILGNSIENLKSSIVKHSGVAQENRFAVYMTPPAQTLFNLDLRNIVTSALSGTFNARNLVNDPRDIAILCESCTLPGRQIMTADYQLLQHSQKRPNSFLNEDVTFTFILTNDYYIKRIFDKWSEQVMSFTNYRANYPVDYVTDVTIVQLNKQNLPIYQIVLNNAYPISFNPITLDNTAENAIQKFSVTMTYDNFFVDNVETPSNTTQVETVKYGPMTGSYMSGSSKSFAVAPAMTAQEAEDKANAVRAAEDRQ